jgi:hypothetical protein
MLAVIGLVFVIWELQGLKRATETTALIGIYGASNEINRFLVQQPAARDHFYADDPNETSDERNARLAQHLEDLAKNKVNEYRALMSFAELEADQFEQVFSLREAMPPGQWNAWWAYFIDTYDSSPLLRDFYNHNEDWYELDDFLALDDDEQRRMSLRRD